MENKAFSHTKEFYEAMAQFEKIYRGNRFEKEDYKNGKVPPGYFYQDGNVNQLFHAFLHGYQYRKAQER